MAYLIYLIIFIGFEFGFYRLFPFVQRKTWEALVPGYNLYVVQKITHRPWWWILLLIFPGVNFLMLSVMSVNTAAVFGRREFKDQLLAAFFPFIYLPWLSYQPHLAYKGPIDRKKFKKSQAQEWVDALVFAVVAASIIRTYVFEAFTIPTSSMEKSLLIGDFLFVSKMAYGPKVPQTPLAFPFAHHTLPMTESVKSYLEWIHLPYYRLPGLGKVERNDVVVFNYPDGDTVVVEQQNQGYQQIVRSYGLQYKVRDLLQDGKLKTEEAYYDLGRDAVWKNFNVVVRPVDKQEHYIKRCVAMPGDKIEVKDGDLFVNNELAFAAPNLQHNYVIKAPVRVREDILKDKLGINLQDYNFNQVADGYEGSMPLEQAKLSDIKKNFTQVEVVNQDIAERDEMRISKAELMGQIGVENTEKLFQLLEENKYYDLALRIFPNHPSYNWTEDNFGPFVIPKKGETVALNLQTLPLYKRAIVEYEYHQLEVKGTDIFVDGEKATTYTFGMDYFWMMGDNRNNSADSRFWGYVPEDHIVGKASLVWMSLDQDYSLFDGKIRWDRFFTLIK